MKQATVLEYAALYRQVKRDSPHNADVRRTCILWAVAGCRAAKRHGLEVMLQAGTAFWRVVAPCRDDGVSPTRYGYQYDPDDGDTHAVQVRLGLGLPEMHAWAAVRLPGGDWHIYDPTTRFVPGLAAGVPPVSVVPPSCMFHLPGEDGMASEHGPGLWSYVCHREACRVAIVVLRILHDDGAFDRQYLVDSGVLSR